MQQHAMLFSMMENRLKNIMEREKVSASQICRDLDLDKGYLSRFLNGKVNISLPRLVEIADYLGYDLQMVKRKHPGKEGEKWGVSIGEEKHTGSSITKTAKRTRNHREAKN